MTTPRKILNARPQREPLSDRIILDSLRDRAAPGEWFEITAQEVAEQARLSITTSALSLNRLAKAGLIEIRSTPGQRRLVRVPPAHALGGAA